MLLINMQYIRSSLFSRSRVQITFKQCDLNKSNVDQKGRNLSPFVRYFPADFPTLKSAFSLSVANRHPLNCLAPPPESTNY